MDIALKDLKEAFEKVDYVAEEEILLPAYLALRLGKPLLVEGAPGVGKTEIAKAMAEAFGVPLIRLQCYEGLDETKALYEWNYQKQLLKIQIKGDGLEEGDLFSEDCLLQRPLLKAIRSPERTVLLIDEVDKVEAEFEAFLFEVLSDFQVSIPELGTVSANHIPVVVLTSNQARDLSDGLKRRCVYLYIDYPGIEKEMEIIARKVPEAPEKLRREVARAVHFLREKGDFRKKPSIAETLDWVRSLVFLDAGGLTPEIVKRTGSLLVKNQEDLKKMERIGLEELVAYAHGG